MESAVSELPAPAAPPDFCRARWLDARLLLGLLLVLLSVVVGAKVFADADQRVQVWSVTRDLGADTPLRGEDLQARSVSLDEATGRYLSAGEDLEGLVLTRPVGRGELLPVSAVGRSDATAKRRIVIEVDRVGVAGLLKGRVVDVYTVRDDRERRGADAARAGARRRDRRRRRRAPAAAPSEAAGRRPGSPCWSTRPTYPT